MTKTVTGLIVFGCAAVMFGFWYASVHGVVIF